MDEPLVVFDVGSTLIHPDFVALADWLKIRTRRDFPAPQVHQAFRHALDEDHLVESSTVDRQATRFFGCLGMGGESRSGWAEWWREIVAAGGVGSWLYTVRDSEALMTLQRLTERGCTLVAASNSDGTLEEELAAFGLLDFFVATYDSARIGAEKPAPAFYRHVLDANGNRPLAIHVGDHIANDLDGALAAGFHRAHLYDPGAFYSHVPSPTRIVRLSQIEALLPPC